jgi:hypothetical protein
LVSSLTYGHSAISVDYPAAAGAMNLAEERALGRRPYFVHVDAPQIWGWRKEPITNRLLQVRIHDYDVRPLNDFGEEQIEQMRVIYPGRYDLPTRSAKKSSNSARPAATASTEIPLVPIYSNRRGLLISQPPLLDIANLNITHYQRQADLIHALHIAAMPTLVLEGWDDTTGNATMGVNYAIAMQPGNKGVLRPSRRHQLRRPNGQNSNPWRSQMSHSRRHQTLRPKVRRRIRRGQTHRPSPIQQRPLDHQPRTGKRPQPSL